MKHASSQYVRAIIVLVCIVAFQQVKAQFYTPTTADLAASNTAVPSAPANSGTDVQRKGSTSTTIQVMVWDGVNPRVSWKDNTSFGWQAIIGTTLGTVTDPDVVTDPTGSGKTLIVYTLTTPAGGSRIYYEQIQISGTTATTLISPTMLSSSAATYNQCSNPNVDVNGLGNVVVTWQSIYGGPTVQTMIFAKASTSIATVLFPAAGNGTTISSSLQLGKPSSAPDVSIQAQGSLTNIVFNYNDNSNRYLLLRQFNVANLVSGSAPTVSAYTLDVIPITSIVGRPRIASTWYTGTGSNPSDAHVVVQINNNIVGYTHDAAVYGAGVFTKIFENKDWGLPTCPNTEPATSYVGDFIIDTWTYNDANCGILNSRKTVLARQLTWDGVPHFPNYSILSVGYSLPTSNSDISSIAGRGATAATANGYYLCWNSSLSDMIYKSSYYMNTNLKTGLDEITTLTTDEPAAVNFSVYPNPTENNLHITFSVADGETANTIEAFDVSGKKVFAQDISSSAVGNNSLDLNTQQWTKGVYLIRVSTDQHTHTTKVVKQ